MVQYMITNGEGMYIRHDKQTNKYVPIRGESGGTMWKDGQKADNIQHALPTSIRQSYYVICVDEKSATSENNPAPNNTNASLTTSPIDEMDSISADIAHELEHWQSGAKDVVGFIQEVNSRIVELYENLSSVDKEVNDLLHFMEFNTFDAYKGYLAYKQMHDTLLRRRKIKDERSVVISIKSCLPDADRLAKILNRMNTLEQRLDNRKYTPRVLTELFE